MRPLWVMAAPGLVATMALAGCAGGGSGAKAAGNPPGPVCERTLQPLEQAAEAEMWNQGVWNEQDPPPSILLRPDGTPIEFSRIPQAPPPQVTPGPSELGPGQEYQSLQQWKTAKKRYAAYHDYTATGGYTPIRQVLLAMDRARPENTVDCPMLEGPKPGAG